MIDKPTNHPTSVASIDHEGALSLDDQVYAPLDAQMVAWLDIPQGARVLSGRTYTIFKIERFWPW